MALVESETIMKIGEQFIGSPPVECWNCSACLSDTFYDARVPELGGWTNLCPICFKELNCRLGQGNGQRFTKNADGLFVKAEG